MFESKAQNIAGNDGMIWFQGIVEDNVDPRQLGRVKVRIFGDHSPDKEDIPTEDLPWALLMMPPGGAATNGLGESPTGIQQGSWVFGFYHDGINKQVPVVMGVFNGVPEKEPDGKIGFHDPDEVFPMKKFLEEPDTNRLARGELQEVREKYTDCEGKPLPESKVTKQGTEKDPEPFLYPMNETDNTEHNILAHKRKMSNLQCQIKRPIPGTFWHQPITQYNAEYPYNKVWEFWNDDEEKWGHALEFDSTPGYERIHLWHSSGSFVEIMNDSENEDCGRRVEKIVGDDFEIDMKNKHLFVKGDYKVSIEGNKEEYIEGNYLMHVVGSAIWMIDGQYVTSPAEFSPSTECKGGLPEMMALNRGSGPGFMMNVTGSGTGTAGSETGVGTNGSEDAYPVYGENPAYKLDIVGDHITDVTEGKKDMHINQTMETYAKQDVTLETDQSIKEDAGISIYNDAGSNVETTAKDTIANEANIISNQACEMLTLEATTILKSTCLLLNNIQDTQTTVTACSPCGSIPQPDDDGDYEILVDEDGNISV